MQLLVTNDDGPSSPLLAATMAWAKTLGTPTFVFPKYEQSWRGKAVTRFEPIHAEEATLHGERCFLVDGTPADCVNLGMYQLLPEKPDLVISGINTGINTGLGFLFSSGTVGACFEANIGRVPGIALSQAFDRPVWNSYATTGILPEDVVGRLVVQFPAVLDRLAHSFFGSPERREQFFQKPLTWNVNIPFVVSSPIRLTPCSVGHTFYGSCFVRQGASSWRADQAGPGAAGALGTWRHQLTEREILLDERQGIDFRIARAGEVAVTPLDLTDFGQLSEGEHEALRQFLA